MKSTNLKIIVLVVSNFFFLLVSPVNSLAKSEIPLAQNGVIDLRDWDFENDGIIPLNGQWNFYWKQFITPPLNPELQHEADPILVPSSWNSTKQLRGGYPSHGFATYHLTVLLPDQRGVLGVLSSRIGHASTIWIDNKLLVKTGRVGKDGQSMIPKLKTVVKFFPYQTHRIDIIIHVSNFVHRSGGLGGEIKIGTQEQILNNHTFSLVIESVMIVCLAILSVYHLFLFFVFEKNDDLSLFICLMFCCAVVRTLTSGEIILLTYLSDVSWDLLKRLEYLVMPVGTYAFVVYFETLFGSSHRLLIRKLFKVFSVLLSLFILVTSVDISSNWLILQQIFLMVGMGYTLFVVFKGKKTNRRLSILFLVGCVILAGAFVNDILYFNDIIDTGVVSHFSFFIPLLMWSVLLSSQHAHAYRKAHYLSNNLELLVDKRTTELNETNVKLEREIIERKKAETDLRTTQKELVEKAHQAGMAEIATNVLHNIGNILNSVKVSAQIIRSPSNNILVANFKKANDIIREKLDSLDELLRDQKMVKNLLRYYLELEKALEGQYNFLQKNILRINQKVDTITDVIVAQQSYAGAVALLDEHHLDAVIEDTLLMHSGFTERYGIQIEKNFVDLPKVLIKKSKLVHILTNLFDNAKDAMLETPVENRKLTISLEGSNGVAYLKVGDTGQGIAGDKFVKIFTHGYTTKKDGHGFGLHSAANYMSEMNGKIWVESEGVNQGATFVLEFAVNEKNIRSD